VSLLIPNFFRTTGKPRRARYWEIDTLRGVAIVMMVIFHLMWDLVVYRILPDVVLYEGFWKYFQRTTAITFITLVGVSLAVTAKRQSGEMPPYHYYLLRGLKIFAWGMIISLGIRLAGIGFVDFGVLHLIGFSVAAAYPFLRLKWANLLLWFLFQVAGYFLLAPTVEVRWLAWLGFLPPRYFPTDYFPIIPWFGVVLLGIFLGNLLYTPRGRTFPLPNLSEWLPFRGLQWLGRHSLVIYVIHQPLLFAILMALGLVSL
jgi:uncharacterized membrane protein